MRERVHRERGAELLELEREDGEDRLDAVDRQRQARLLRGVVDRVVELVPVEDLQARGGEVGADVAGVGRVPADLLGARDRILRRDHDRPAQGRLVAEPAVGEPLVVRPCERDGERRVSHHCEREQVIGEEHGLVHVQRVELASHRGRALDHLRAVRPARPRDAEFGARRHRGQVEVALLDLRDLTERDVPRRCGVLRELRGILVHVDVGIDDPDVRRRLAGAGRGGAVRRLGHRQKIIL